MTEYDYTIYSDNSPKEFKKTCVKLEKAFPNASSRFLVDVDGSTIQTFTENGKDIDVYDDYEVCAVFVKSKINLDALFK